MQRAQRQGASDCWTYATRYLQYNWLGDAVTILALDGMGGWITSVYKWW
jgi:hypothetical protein